MFGWNNEKYTYSIGKLRGIAAYYRSYCADGDHVVEDKRGTLRPISWLDAAEEKADFDRALNAIGRGHWDGEMGTFEQFKLFGRKQITVIADILEVSDSKLEQKGFYDVGILRGRAYNQMMEFLNGNKI